MKIARRMIAPLVLLASLAFAATQLLAHAVVYPAAAKPGAYERYVLRVPNEREVATTRVEIRFPANVTVISFSDVVGWDLQVQTDSAQRIVGALWTGSLAPKRFVELPFIAVNPRASAELVWPAFQTYADGERVEWTGAPGSDRPASVTAIGDGASAAESPGDADSAPSETDAAGDSGADGSGAALPVSIAALVAALIAMGIAIGARGRTR